MVRRTDLVKFAQKSVHELYEDFDRDLELDVLDLLPL